MIALYIILGIILFLFLVLLLPITVYLCADGDVKCKVYLLKIKVFDLSKMKKSKPKKEKKAKEKEKEEKPKEDKKKDSFVKDLIKKKKEEYGTVGVIKYFGKIVGIFFNKIVWIIRKLKFSKIIIKLNIGSEDAAKTAVEYGAVCTAAYPVLSLITANAKVKYKSIDISADFNSTCITGKIEFCVTMRIIYFVIGLILGFIEYKKIKKESVK